jgi:hypothetical protein
VRRRGKFFFQGSNLAFIDLLWTGEQKNSSQPIRTHSDIVFSKTFNNVKVETAINASDLVRGGKVLF